MPAAALGIIGGTGFAPGEGMQEIREQPLVTPFSPEPVALTWSRMGGRALVSLQRHGVRRNVPPHRIDYRANLWALREVGVRQVIAVAAVGGIEEAAHPGRLVIPDQLIDYTWGREHTFFAEDLERVHHVDFTSPYDARLRAALIDAARRAGIDALERGCYAATQGPRLETAAEIRKLEIDGCTIVGMTGMPEAALARELELAYACCALVVNRAAGKGDEPIDMARIEHCLVQAMQDARALLAELTNEERE